MRTDRVDTNRVKSAWLDVGDELESVALKLKLHLEQEMSDDDDVDAVLDRLANRIHDAIEAAENAAEDPAVRDDLRETGRRLVDAMSTTFHAATRATRSYTRT